MNTSNPLPPPGPELDRFICEKLGYTWYGAYNENEKWGRWIHKYTGVSAFEIKWRYTEAIDQPRYSTTWDAAGELIEKGKLLVAPLKDGRYFAGVIGHVRPGPEWEDGAIDCYFEKGWAIADTGPHAIALAFLALPDEVISNVSK